MIFHLFLLALIHVSSFVAIPYQMVSVKTCEGEYAAIYSDKRLTIQIANPMVADSKGRYSFYTPANCVEIE